MKASKRIGKRQGAWTNPQYKYKANPRWTTKITHLNSDIFRKWHGLADWGWHYIDTHDWSLYGHKGCTPFFSSRLCQQTSWHHPCCGIFLARVHVWTEITEDVRTCGAFGTFYLGPDSLVPGVCFLRETFLSMVPCQAQKWKIHWNTPKSACWLPIPAKASRSAGRTPGRRLYNQGLTPVGNLYMW